MSLYPLYAFLVATPIVGYGLVGKPQKVSLEPSQDTTTSKSKKSATPTDKRSKDWRQSRTMGFASFSIPIAFVAMLFRHEAVNKMFTSLDASMWWEAAQITATYFALWAVKEVGLNLFKYWLMVKQFGISYEHYKMIIGPRTDWTGEEISTLVKTYTHYRIKVMDAISRRAGHTLINIFRITFFSLVPTTALRFQTACLQLPIIFSLKLLTESGNTCKDLGRFVFQGSRVMDGQYGRFNLVVVNFWAYAGRIIMFQMLTIYGFSDAVSKAMFMLSFMPLLWGDTFGELIGSFYGKHQFEVRGLGEVNKKSVEGTVAVFVSSFVSMLISFYWFGGLPNDIFVFHPAIVFFYTCVMAAIVESAAPRSTDNFFLETGTLLLLLLSLDPTASAALA